MDGINNIYIIYIYLKSIIPKCFYKNGSKKQNVGHPSRSVFVFFRPKELRVVCYFVVKKNWKFGHPLDKSGQPPVVKCQ